MNIFGYKLVNIFKIAEHLENIDFKWLSSIVDVYGIDRDERIRNKINDVDYFLTLLEKIDTIKIDKTVDKEANIVINFKAKDGTSATLWLNSNNQLRTITPY